jgi:hypothetical protein
MKILYVGSNRADAVTVATSLRSLAADAVLVWTPRLERATTWIDQHADAAALIVEAPVDHDCWRSVVERLRHLDAHPAVLCIADAAAGVDTLEPPPDDIVARNASWLRDLPAAVRRALDRAHARQRAELHALVEQERAARTDLERQLAAASAALDDSHERHRAAAATAAEQLGKVRHQHEVSMQRAAATREMLDEQLRFAAIEVERSRQQHASAAADVDRLSRRESELSALIAEAAAVRLTLERGAADDAGRQRELEARIAEERDGRTRSDESLAHSTAEIERLTERGAVLTKRVADLEAHRDALARQMVDARRALDDSAGRERDLEARLEREGAARTAFEQAAAEAAAVVRVAQDRHRDLEARIAEQIDRRNRSEASLEQSVADVERLSGQSAALTTRVADLEAERASLAGQVADLRRALEDSAGRERELDGRIQNERAARATLGQALTDAQGAIRLAQERHEAALAASARDMAERQAQFDRQLTEAAAVRAGLAERLTGAETAVEQLRRDHLAATAEIERAARERAIGAERQADLEAQVARGHEAAETLRTEAREQAARFEKQIAGERHDHNAQMAETHEWHRRLLLESDTLQQSLGALQHRADRLDVELSEARAQLAQVQSTAEADVRRLTTERLDVERVLEDARRSFHTSLESLSNEHEIVVAALAVAVGDRDAQLREEAAGFVAAQQAAEAARTALQNDLQTKLAARDRDVEQLQATLTAVHETLEAAKRRQEILQTQADQVAHLRRLLEGTRTESDRQFHQAPLAMFRCTKDGALAYANRAWNTLISRNVDELRGARFATTVFESPTDLSGLIEQCLATNANESIETTLRRKDGARLFVRLSAFASPAGLIEIAAENLTRVRVLQDRLDRAHRMEAIGRLSSEVALNCTALLNDVHQKARQWLSVADVASRQDGEALLQEVIRVTRSLQQLVAHGDQKSRTRAVVDLNVLVRDLAPVLKRIAGDEVEIQLRDSAGPLSVDIEIERIERLLVNLAALGRERMRAGGTLAIDVGAVMVDLGFVARHPQVRPGPHALITVSESRLPLRADRQLLLSDGSIADSSPAGSGLAKGIDLGALQRLVGGCGGHLWMTVQPRGGIVAKVRLPLVTAYDQPSSRALAALGERGRTLTRWFQR